MGIVVTKKQYRPIHTEDTINYDNEPYRDGVHMVPYKDKPVQHYKVSSTPKENRHAFAGDVV